MTPAILALLVAAEVATPAAPVPPTPRVFAVDLGAFAQSLRGGDLVVPVVWRWAPWSHVGTSATVLGGFATGAGLGLFGVGGRVGIEWYPASVVPFEGFAIGLQGGLDVIGSATEPAFGGLRPALSLGLAWTFRIAEGWLVTPGLALNLNIFGLGFPLPPGFLLARLAVAWP